MVAAEDVVRTLRKNKTDEIKLTAVYDKPVKAPTIKGRSLAY